MQNTKNQPKRTSTISPEMLAKTKEISFQARAEWGYIYGLVDDLIKDEHMVNRLTDTIIGIVNDDQDNMHGEEWTGIFKTLTLLNRIQHLQYLQAKSGKEEPIY